MTMTLEINDDIAVIHMDDGKVNAVGHDFITRLNGMFDEVEGHARAIVLAGRPGRCSAGFDLGIMLEGPEKAAELVNYGGEILLRLFSHPLPTVAACTGHALAAGAIFLLTCDTRLGTRGDFKLGLNETAIGMTMPVFGLELARARLAPRHLSAAVAQAKIYTPEEACEIGYLDTLHDEGEILPAAIAAAGQLASLPADAYRANKMNIHAEAIGRIRQSLNK